MSPNPTHYTRYPQKDPRRPTLLPHHRTRSRAPLAHPTQRRSLHAFCLHHESHARHRRQVPNRRAAPRTTDPDTHGARPNRRRVRPLIHHALLLRRRTTFRRNTQAAREEVPQHRLQARLRHDRILLVHHRAPAREVLVRPRAQSRHDLRFHHRENH